MLKLLSFVSVILSANLSVKGLAPFIKPCPISDSTCITTSAKAALPYFAAGIPELGIKPLDPLRLAVIKGDQDGLQLTFKNTVVTGLGGAVIEDVKQEFEKGRLSVKTRMSVALRGDYKLGGQLLIFPIQGEGKYNISIQDIIIKAHADLESVQESVQGDGGAPHWNITRWRHSYQVRTGAQFRFDNLFNGNKILAGPVQEFVNLNWREVMQEVAPPIVRAIVAVVVADVSALYKMVPIEKLHIL